MHSNTPIQNLMNYKLIKPAPKVKLNPMFLSDGFFDLLYLHVLFQELCKRLNRLMDHHDERKRDQKTWVLNQVLVVAFIQKVLGLTEESMSSKLFSDASIHRAVGLLRTNSVKLDSPIGYTTGTAIYPTFSLLNHSCLCNTRTKKYAYNGVSFFVKRTEIQNHVYQTFAIIFFVVIVVTKCCKRIIVDFNKLGAASSELEYH